MSKLERKGRANIHSIVYFALEVTTQCFKLTGTLQVADVTTTLYTKLLLYIQSYCNISQYVKRIYWIG